MVDRGAPSMIMCSAGFTLLCWCSAWSVVNAYSTSSFNYERYLPEDDSSDNDSYYSYYTKKSKKGYYQYYGAKGSKGSHYTKSDKKRKDCKSAKKKGNYYGYYDHCFEDETISSNDGNFTDLDFIDEMFIDDLVTEAPKSYGSKGSKSGGYYSKSDKKSDKKIKSDKFFKSYKQSKKDKSYIFKRPTPALVQPAEPKMPDLGFPPDESWTLTFEDATDTGFLFYDSITKYAWYAYNAKVGEDSSNEDAEATIGRICPIDTVDTKKVLEDLCIDIKAPEDWGTVTSTTIQSVEACYGLVTGAIFKLAVIVKDSSRVLHLEDSLVGSRLLVYDIVVSGKAVVPEPIIVEAAYEGWKSLYGEPTINGRPSFTPDCKRVYTTWLAPDEAEAEEYTSITIATAIESSTKDGESAELWRLGTSSHLPGLTASKDGTILFSATNVPKDDDLNAGGVIALNSNNGQILQEYVFPTNDPGLPNNAFTNLVIDDDGNSYHIDSLLGLVKFDLDDFNDGPVWSAVESSTKMIEESIETAVERQGSRELAPLTATRDKDSKLLMEEEDMVAENMVFTAFQPALDENSTVYGCGNTASGNNRDGVVALSTANGESVWFAEFDDLHTVNVGSCSGITHDIIWGTSAASTSGSAVYVGRGKVIQAFDSSDGTLLWTYDTQGQGGAAQFVVVSEGLVLAANTGTIIALDTIEPVEPTSSPVSSPTTPSEPTVPTVPTDPTPIQQPTKTPTRAPLSTPAPVTPAPFGTVVQTAPPSSGVSKPIGLSFAVAVSLSLPLLVLLR